MESQYAAARRDARDAEVLVVMAVECRVELSNPKVQVPFKADPCLVAH
jgi:hypothetical protein